MVGIERKSYRYRPIRVNATYDILLAMSLASRAPITVNPIIETQLYKIKAAMVTIETIFP